MKVELTLVLENSNNAFEILENIKLEGFNATVINTESLRHMVDYYPGEHHFLSLRQLEKDELLQSVLCVFIVDDNQLEALKQVIRNQTDNFSLIKGFMYSRPINDYEGSI